MKRSLLTPILVIALIILSTTAVALAEDPTATRTKPFVIQERRAEFQANMEAKREAFGERMDEFRKERIGTMLTMMQRRFVAAIERLGNIADRIDTRIAKIEEVSDRDLSEASGYVDDAREHLEAAQDLIDDMSTSTADSLFDNASSTGNRFGMIRTLFAEAKTELQAARDLLGKALRAIGQSSGREKPATTTSSN